MHPGRNITQMNNEKAADTDTAKKYCDRVDCEWHGENMSHATYLTNVHRVCVICADFQGFDNYRAKDDEG